ncbi:MAG TPA: hypothetical protein DCY61_02670, partial [Dehalococcoidia bacterium]|nr:hypothetical protein [Dehalococcoidia bacterium]
YRDYGDDFISAPAMWDKGLDGSGIRIAILDTGICRYHPDLDGGKVIAERDFTVWDRFSEEEIGMGETNDYSITLKDARDLWVTLRWGDPANDLKLIVTDPDGNEHSGIDIGDYRRIFIPGPIADGDWTIAVVGTTVTATESYSLKKGFNSAWDDHETGHGTHVAGIAAGAYNPEIGITGVAPGAHLINAKVLNVDGDTQTSWLISAVEWSVEKEADVINLSLGGWQGDGAGRDLLDMAVTHAASAGHILIIAAGNWGPDESTIASPAVAHGAIAVAASNSVDEIVFFSSRGPAGDGRVGVDLTAPGLGIIAPIPLLLHPTGYADWAGTSMSAPHVAGAAALLLQAFPELTPSEMERALKNSAGDLFFGILEQGAGRLDIEAAYLALKQGILVDHEWSVGGVLPGDHTKIFTVENRAAEAKTLPIDWSVMTDTQDFLAGGWITVPGEVTVPAGETASFMATMSVPPDTTAGTYVGSLTLGDILIPVSVNIIQPVVPGTSFDITGTVDEDWDFIHYTLDVKPGTTELGLSLDWTDEVNDLDIFLFNPQGDLAAMSFWDYPEAISINHPTPGQWTVAIMAWWLAIPETFTLRGYSTGVSEITAFTADPAVRHRETTFLVEFTNRGLVTVNVEGEIRLYHPGEHDRVPKKVIPLSSASVDGGESHSWRITEVLPFMPGRYEATARVLFNGRITERSISLRIIPEEEGVLAGITLEPLVALTNIPSQLLTGAVQAGATVELSAEPEAVFGEVVYPAPLTWECEIELSEGKNVITAIATIDGVVVGRVEARITLDTVAPTIITILPEVDAVDAAPGVDIAVTFSEEMDRASAEEAFSIEPAVSGIFRWVENTMTFEPEVELEYGTFYTVTLSPAPRDLAGNELAMHYTWGFSIQRVPLNRALIGGIIGAVVVIVGLLVYFLAIRGKKGKQAGVRGVEPP